MLVVVHRFVHLSTASPALLPRVGRHRGHSLRLELMRPRRTDGNDRQCFGTMRNVVIVVCW